MTQKHYNYDPAPRRVVVSPPSADMIHKAIRVITDRSANDEEFNEAIEMLGLGQHLKR